MIHVTGFPLPVENVGLHREVVQRDLARRLKNLDPYGLHVDDYREFKKADNNHQPLTITYAVGGAGALAELGTTIISSLAGELRKNTLRLRLVAGVRSEVRDQFQRFCEGNGFKDLLGKNISIYYFENKKQYFQGFNELIRDTDILWTKPSELVFYAGFGLPIIIAPSLRSHS